MSATKGHWPKGKSRNLDPSRVSQAKTLIDLLNRAINQGWRHPTHGVLTGAKAAEVLAEDRSTVHKWLTGKRLPPLRILTALRQLLREYTP